MNIESAEHLSALDYDCVVFGSDEIWNICNPFSAKDVEVIDKLNIDAWKIASGEFNNFILLDKILKKSNLLISNIIGLPFDAYYVSYLSSRYKKTSLLNSLLVGFISNFKAKYTNNMFSSLIYIGKKNMIERE